MARSPGSSWRAVVMDVIQRHGEGGFERLAESLRGPDGKLTSTNRRKLGWAKYALHLVRGTHLERVKALPPEQVGAIEANRRREIREKPRKRGNLIPVETCAAIGAVVRAEVAKETRKANRRLVAGAGKRKP